MNHPSAWCVETIQIGCVTYTQSQAIAIMRHNSSQDKTYSLAQQLIAAKLNRVCRHANTSCVASDIAAADAFLCAHPVGCNCVSKSDWNTIKASHARLDKYNNGRLCAPVCHEDQ